MQNAEKDWRNNEFRGTPYGSVKSERTLALEREDTRRREEWKQTVDRVTEERPRRIALGTAK